MKVWHSDYQLIPKGAASSSGRMAFRKGSLLRVDFGDHRVGYADLCPFPEFGDSPLEIELANIQNEKYSNLARRSLDCARIDAEARVKEESLYNERRIKNHYLITNLLEFDLQQIPILQGQSFSQFKVKLGKNLQVETEMLRALVQSLAADSLLRLDFNFKLNQSVFMDWWESHRNWLAARVEFVEDPFPYSSKEWREVADQMDVTMALDFFNEEKTRDLSGAQVLVIKPAVQDLSLILQSLEGSGARPGFVFTHYLDFPLGQMYAYHVAQKFAATSKEKLLSCGLQMQNFYESFQFQELVGLSGPYVNPPEGFGLGFDQALERQDWRSLV